MSSRLQQDYKTVTIFELLSMQQGHLLLFWWKPDKKSLLVSTHSLFSCLGNHLSEGENMIFHEFLSELS